MAILTLKQARRMGCTIAAAAVFGVWAAGAPAAERAPKQASAAAAAKAAAEAADAAAKAMEAVEAAAEAQAPSPEEQETVARIEAAVDAGRYDEAIDLAKASVRTIKNEGLKTRVTHLVAQAQRKKKDWSRALAAYLALRDRFDKGSDEYIRYDAVAGILRASKDGVYYPLAEANGGDTSKTLDDDAVLAEALAVMARKQAEGLPLKLQPVASARTVEDLMKRFVPLVEELRRLRVLWPDLSASHDRSAVQTMAMRLADLGEKTIALLGSKQAEFEAMQKSRVRNTQVEAAMVQHRSMCERMIAAEKALTAAMDALKGAADWPEGQKLREDSAKRQAAYAELAQALTPGKDRGKDGGGHDWRRDMRDWQPPGGF